MFNIVFKMLGLTEYFCFAVREALCRVEAVYPCAPNQLQPHIHAAPHASSGPSAEGCLRPELPVVSPPHPTAVPSVGAAGVRAARALCNVPSTSALSFATAAVPYPPKIDFWLQNAFSKLQLNDLSKFDFVFSS